MITVFEYFSGMTTDDTGKAVTLDAQLTSK
jgi:hypothetical protein